jgi:hypothetical protein
MAYMRTGFVIGCSHGLNHGIVGMRRILPGVGGPVVSAILDLVADCGPQPKCGWNSADHMDLLLAEAHMSHDCCRRLEMRQESQASDCTSADLDEPFVHRPVGHWAKGTLAVLDGSSLDSPFRISAHNIHLHI